MNKPSFALGNSLIIFASLAMFISVMSLNSGYSNIQSFTTVDTTDLSEFTQLTAEINKPVTWIKNDTQQIVETEPPEVVETDTSEVDGKLQKRVTISSDFHYEKILTYASVPNLLSEQVRLFWMIDGIKTDVTEREDFNVTFYDEDGDTLIDKISWITPHLSEQEFILEFDITVINPWESGISGGDWIVYFNTTGTGTLNITKDELSNQVLTFNYIKCGDTILYSSMSEYSYILEDYSCSETAEISHTIGQMPMEIFGMQFDFGNDINNDVDFAYDPDFTADADSDGIFDLDELLLGTDPADPLSPAYRAATGCNALPFVGPMLGPCTGDGVGADPANCDEDGDCISDFAESWIAGGGGEYFNAFGVQYNAADTDGGGVNDHDEIVAGTDPSNPGDDGGGGGGSYPNWATAPTCSTVNSNSGTTVCDADLSNSPGGVCDNNGAGHAFSITAETTSEVDCAIANGVNFTITPASNWYGTASCTVRCTDTAGAGGTADSVVSITVNNQAPTSSTPTLTPTSPTTSSNLTATAVSFSDPESEALTAIFDFRKETVSIAKLNAQFNTNSSSAINDYSSLSNDLTNNGADWKNAGTCGLTGSGGCYDLTKVSSTSGDYLYRADDSDFDGMSAISACLWVKPDSTISDTTYFISKGDAFKLYYQSGVGLRWGLDQAGGYGSATFTGGSWHHVCGTWDTTSDESKIYHNANLISTDSRVLTTTGSNSNQIRIGAGGAAYYWPVDGLVDGAQIYDVALTGDQITKIYNSGTPNYTVIDSSMTSLGENWTVAVTPNDAAQDGSTQTSATRNIGVANTAPTDISWDSGDNDIAENSASTTVVGTLSETDSQGGSMTWTEQGSGNGTSLFEIASSTGVVTVSSGTSLNYETATLYGYPVRVTDSGGLYYDETMTIDVTNVNEAPTWSTVIPDHAMNADNATAEIDEELDDSPGGVCTDVDASTTFSFTVQTENTAQVDCTVSGTSLSVTPATNYSGTASCTIRCSDGSLTADDTFNIVVSKTISMSISTNLTNDLDWSIANTTGATFDASANGGTGASSYYVTIEAHGGEPNVTIKSSGDLSKGSGTDIGIGNFTYKNSTTNTVPGSATAMTTSYVNAATNLAADASHIVYFKFFLTVPSATSAGTYNTTTYFRGNV